MDAGIIYTFKLKYWSFKIDVSLNLTAENATDIPNFENFTLIGAESHLDIYTFQHKFEFIWRNQDIFTD